MTRLLNIKKDSKIYGLEPNGDKDGVVVFDHIDGMYSLCYAYNGDGTRIEGLIHLNAMTPLVEYKDGYKVAESED